MKWINYHHLIYFREIANCGSISKASKNLNVGQPALSSQLKSLEEYLGVQLFERKSRRLFLTDSGRVALEYADKISKLGQELIQVFEDNSFYGSKPHLSVGALDGIPKHLIYDILEFAHKKTDCYMSITEDSIDTLMRELTSHKVDVIISDHSVSGNEQGSIVCKKILDLEVAAFASPEFIGARRKFPESLDGLPCIIPTSHSKLHSDLEHFFHLNGIRPQVLAETQDTSLQKMFASRGDGVIFLPVFAAKELVKQKKLIKLGILPDIYIEYFLIMSKRLIENPVLDVLFGQDFSRMRLG